MSPSLTPKFDPGKFIFHLSANHHDRSLRSPPTLGGSKNGLGLEVLKHRARRQSYFEVGGNYTILTITLTSVRGWGGGGPRLLFFSVVGKIRGIDYTLYY